MRNLSWSFVCADAGRDDGADPHVSYFVFDIDTGETLKQGIKHVRQARAEWIRLRGV